MKNMKELTKGALNDLSSQLEVQSQSTDFETEIKDFYRCEDCSKTWSEASRYSTGYSFSSVCQECKAVRRKEEFKKICPPLYQESDTSRFPSQYEQAMKWKYGSKGLILLGETGKCKTRIAWEVIRKTFESVEKKISFRWFDCVGFGHELAKHYKSEDAETWLEDTASVGMLFFDDLGKLKMTERAEVELFGLIERRFAFQLPIIVTTNDTGNTLAARMTDNRGPALIRRLREFCEPIQF